MIEITDKVLCCGCNACGDVCHKKAITFKTDQEGFWYPEVNKSICIDCGLCEKVCPIINVQALKKNDLPQSECYVAVHKNISVVFDSTSGGMFTALAEQMYRNEGYVGGAVFTEDFSVKHFISNEKEDLLRIRNSKYLQSDLQGFYLQVKDLVKKGENVLVCGSPCQMAALRAFLGKDYDNLIIADYICRGINSPKVWHKYLDSFEERYGSKVVYCKSKSKEFGWRNLTQKVILANGKHYYETREQSNFTRGYLRTGAFCRPSCYDCKFKGYPRMADITLADFWGIEKVDKSLDKNLGNSLVMVNSQKGRAFWENIKNKVSCISVPFESIEAGNRALRLSVPPPSVDRKQFFEDLDKMTFLQIADKYLTRKQTFKQKVKYELKYLEQIARATQLHPSSVYRLFKYNTLKEIISHNVVVPTPHTVIEFRKGCHVLKKGVSVLGAKKFMSSKLETRIMVKPGGTLAFDGPVNIAYGANIEVFSGATLRFGGNNNTNFGATIICGDTIEIGQDTMLGRSVIIRDNNGDHYLNQRGYKNSRPVIIGEKVWLCESCTVMPGVKIGDGAIVGALAVVTRNVPDHCLVNGAPAEVISENVLWKY